MSEATSRVPIGGWLVIPAIALIAAPFLELFTILSNLDAWSSVTGAVETLVEAEIVMAALLFGLDLFVAVQFFRRRDSAPTLMEIWFGARAAVTIIDYLWASSIASPREAETLSTIRSVIASAIWILYFRRSTRVQRTFNQAPEAESGNLSHRLT